MDRYRLHLGDCLEVLRTLPDHSIDSIVTDPPYGLSKEPEMAKVLRHWLAGDDYQHKGGGFMGKSWDSFVPGPAVWRECLRVLKPGGHLLAFFGTRTQDIGTLAIRLAGFEIRDSIAWVYSTGFPKSMNLDRLQGEQICGCERAGEAKTERDVRPMRGRNVSSSEHAGDERRKVLQQGVQEQSSPTGSLQCTTAAQGSGELGLEGRRHATQAPRELCLSEIHSCAGACASDDPQRRVHHGASLGDGVLDRTNSAAYGSGASHRPQPTEQRPLKPGALAGQPEPQAMGAWPVCGGCSLPRVPAGLGTALKPALEPITVARKPLAKGCTVAANVLTHGTGALNIDGCRVATDDALGGGAQKTVAVDGKGEGWQRPWMHDAEAVAAHASRVNANVAKAEALGRWPANLIHDGSDEVVALFPHTKSGVMKAGTRRSAQDEPGSVCYGTYGGNATSADTFGDDGSAARFFYCAKASRRDRNDGMPSSSTPAVETNATMRDREDADWSARNGNHHPTVKPTDLMAYLCRLVTPPGGVVLDPFMGSGSTGKAAMREGFQFIGCELSPDYLDIAEARIKHELGKSTQSGQMTLDGLEA